MQDPARRRRLPFVIAMVSAILCLSAGLTTAVVASGIDFRVARGSERERHVTGGAVLTRDSGEREVFRFTVVRSQDNFIGRWPFIPLGYTWWVDPAERRVLENSKIDQHQFTPDDFSVRAMPEVADIAARDVREVNWQWAAFNAGLIATLFLLLAACATITVVGVRQTRASARRRRGRCVACGYDLGGIERCPECGLTAGR